ncbi:MAG: hypothetical protein ACYDHP_02950 [Ferrimicrobium sp.]
MNVKTNCMVGPGPVSHTADESLGGVICTLLGLHERGRAGSFPGVLDCGASEGVGSAHPSYLVAGDQSVGRMWRFSLGDPEGRPSWSCSRAPSEVGAWFDSGRVGNGGAMHGSGIVRPKSVVGRERSLVSPETYESGNEITTDSGKNLDVGVSNGRLPRWRDAAGGFWVSVVDLNGARERAYYSGVKV